MVDAKGQPCAEPVVAWCRPWPLCLFHQEALDSYVRAQRHPRGFVYFLHNEHDDLIKIGHSWNPYWRRKQLESDFGFPLRELGSHSGSRADETATHRRFAASRFSGSLMGREWYWPTPELLTHIEKVVSES